MKAITTKELVSVIGMLMAAAVFTLVILVSARAAAVVNDDLLLLALALSGAVVSGINGFGRRSIKTTTQRNSVRRQGTKVVLNS